MLTTEIINVEGFKVTGREIFAALAYVIHARQDNIDNIFKLWVEKTSYFLTNCLVKIFRPLKENPTRSIIITVRNTRQANDADFYGKILRRIDNKKLGRVIGNMRDNIARVTLLKISFCGLIRVAFRRKGGNFFSRFIKLAIVLCVNVAFLPFER